MENKENNFITENVIKLNHRLYLIGLGLSFSVLIGLFIFLFISDSSKQQTILSAFISVIGGVFASFLIAYIIEISSTSKENKRIISCINYEAHSIASTFNDILEIIQNDILKTENNKLDYMFSNFPYESFDITNDSFLTVYVYASIIESSIDTILNLDSHYSNLIFKNGEKDSFLGFKEGLIEFRESCIAKNNKRIEKITIDLSNILCLVYFADKLRTK